MIADPAAPHDRVFVEDLTLRGWCLAILPDLLRRRGRPGTRPARCYLFEGSGPALAVAQACRWLTGVPVERLSFRLLEVRDAQGTLIEERTRFEDLSHLLDEALAGPVGRWIRSAALARPHLAVSVSKEIVGELRRPIWLIQVAAWAAKRDGAAPPAVLWLDRRVWNPALTRYAAHERVSVRQVAPRVTRDTFVRACGPVGYRLALTLRDRWRARHHRGGRGPGQPVAAAGGRPSPRIAVTYFGNFNWAHPERNSDLFMVKHSAIPSRNVLLLLNQPVPPMDHDALRAAGFSAVALNGQAAAGGPWPLFTHAPRPPLAPAGQARWPRPQARWVQAAARAHAVHRAYWVRLFEQERILVHCSWFRYDAKHCAVAEAVRAVGGVATLYQRAYQFHPSPLTATAVDVSFSAWGGMAEIERSSGSHIPYQVTTGFLGDYRFVPLRRQAEAVRRQLQQAGATRIVAFFDENSIADTRWHTGHELQREGYAFWATQVLRHPWLGVVIKPKAPGTLQHRLGPVAELLARAQATGRLYVYTAAAWVYSPYPPAAAALAADVAVHGCLAAATAGIEAALAGVPTLLMDREGWPLSPLYALGAGRVVFTEWETMWEACQAHWRRPGGVPGFGDWSSMIATLDPFRDGRAAERMGTYLQWLLEGFQAGLPRETVLADSAARYAAQWGRDKIMAIVPGGPPAPEAAAAMGDAVTAGAMASGRR